MATVRGKPLEEFIRTVQRYRPDAFYHRQIDENHQQQGMSLEGHFYPVWELNDPANAELLARFDFEGIRKRRPANWSPFL